MIAVIFEVWPKADRKQDYLNIAADLKPLLEKIDGFISIERFESLYEPGKILSLSFFRDEAAVQAWRTTNEHRVAQAKGRGEIFANYRLRVTGVIRDYGMRERAAGSRRQSQNSPWIGSILISANLVLHAWSRQSPSIDTQSPERSPSYFFARCRLRRRTRGRRRFGR